MELLLCCICFQEQKWYNIYVQNTIQINFKISIVHCTQTNQSIVNYFENQRYQSFKSKNVDSKYEQNVRKRDAFAMIRQLGFPSIFITQSVAETKWKDLLKCLGKTVHTKEYTSEEIDAMDYKTKCELIQWDSPTLVCFFENHFTVFMKDVVKSKCKPIGEVNRLFLEKRICIKRCYTCSLVCIYKWCSSVWWI